MEPGHWDRGPEEDVAGEWEEASGWEEWEEPARVPVQVVTVSARNAGRLPLTGPGFLAIK